MACTERDEASGGRAAGRKAAVEVSRSGDQSLDSMGGLAVSMAQGQTAEAELPAHSERARPREEVVRGELRAEEKPG